MWKIGHFIEYRNKVRPSKWRGHLSIFPQHRQIKSWQSKESSNADYLTNHNQQKSAPRSIVIDRTSCRKLRNVPPGCGVVLRCLMNNLEWTAWIKESHRFRFICKDKLIDQQVTTTVKFLHEAGSSSFLGLYFWNIISEDWIFRYKTWW